MQTVTASKAKVETAVHIVERDILIPHADGSLPEFPDDFVGLLKRCCDSDFALEAFRRNVRREVGGRTLMTILRPTARSVATNTRDMPPRPSSRSIV